MLYYCDKLWRCTTKLVLNSTYFSLAKARKVKHANAWNEDFLSILYISVSSMLIELQSSFIYQNGQNEMFFIKIGFYKYVSSNGIEVFPKIYFYNMLSIETVSYFLRSDIVFNFDPSVILSHCFCVCMYGFFFWFFCFFFFSFLIN